ncbi:acyltransferase family protein [Actinosynnema sp. CS-041913]|uniref:acyltransferase family protein n=1 Tax=Actinosynnema sp. CS-041913 TaxID=3239917 RepID=UPI003D946307
MRSTTGSPGAQKSQSPAIHGIRGLAAMALLTVHVAMFSGLFGTKATGVTVPPSNFLGAFFVSGLPSFIGVFFVLPALFLYLPIAKAVISGDRLPPQRNQLIRRLCRLLPAYYAMFLVVLVALHREAVDGVWYVLRPLLLLQVYLPSPFHPNLLPGLEITWTVPTMVQWYLVLPLIAWAVHRFARRGATPAARARRLMLPVPVLIAVGIGWLFFVKAHDWDNRIVFWWPQGFAPAIGVGMGLAIMLALARVSPADTPRLLRLAATRPHLCWLGAVTVYLVNCARPFSVIGMDAIYSVAGLLVTYVMVMSFGLLATLPLVSPGARRVRLVDAVLTNGPVVHLGRISYGVYLWHFAVMHFYLQHEAIFDGGVRPIRELYGKAGFVELWTVTAAGTVAIASISYYLLERPITTWSNRRFRDDTTTSRRPQAPIAPTVDMSTVDWDVERATSAVAGAVADRDTIRTNLTELEHSPGRQLLAQAELTGLTGRRRQAVSTDLVDLWELFRAYSAVVDEAARLLAGRRDLAALAALLTGPSVLVTAEPTPLHRRKITEDGHTRLTVAAAVERMNRQFQETAELVAIAETVWHETSGRLTDLRADLARANAHAPGDAALAEALAAADADLHRLAGTVSTDPLALWRHGRADTAELDRLRQTVTALLDRIATPNGATPKSD